MVEQILTFISVQDARSRSQHVTLHINFLNCNSDKGTKQFWPQKQRWAGILHFCVAKELNFEKFVAGAGLWSLYSEDPRMMEQLQEIGHFFIQALLPPFHRFPFYRGRWNIFFENSPWAMVPTSWDRSTSFYLEGPTYNTNSLHMEVDSVKTYYLLLTAAGLIIHFFCLPS